MKEATEDKERTKGGKRATKKREKGYKRKGNEGLKGKESGRRREKWRY